MVPQRMAYNENLRRSLLQSVAPSVPSSTPSTPRGVRSSRNSALATPPVMRTDSVVIPEILRAPRSSTVPVHRASGGTRPTKSENNVPIPTTVGDVDGSAAGNTTQSDNGQPDGSVSSSVPSATNNEVVTENAPNSSVSNAVQALNLRMLTLQCGSDSPGPAKSGGRPPDT